MQAPARGCGARWCRKLTIGKMTVSRLAIFGVAAVILLAGVIALGILLFGKRSTGLNYEKADVISGYQYRMKGDRLSYRTRENLYTYDCEANSSTYYSAPYIDGYDSSSSLTIVYAGSLIAYISRNCKPKSKKNTLFS